MTNCPNCGAPLEMYKVHCPYCGTYYFDLSAFDVTKKCFVKFKTYINGQECYITALARPSLEEVEVTSDSEEWRDHSGAVLKSFISSKTCNLKANFSCEINPENKSLFVVEVRE